ncbi:TIGR03808 family TAT-translocated repetitive protein [Mesorhizobium sp. RP14(2022)]|uniref:TIGR03808 family TAT-translocated repetitive protein n=1 Tax=Mesorhizobium liriopis TaxID=2953882 RepID=A0ABT1C1A4_9HYPH|nr:TIGR03808 family TAT-translocated repetitive protein [Mesorhizobium liriopis]MCO6048604.1 TIGR03808 family TAT-translocated repetitive protein [Mesorhizobium liriopis]
MSGSEPGSEHKANRRKLFRTALALPVLGAALTGQAAAQTAPLVPVLMASDFGVLPGTVESRALSRLLAESAQRNLPIFFAPGDYDFREFTSPGPLRLVGVPGATRFILSRNTLVAQDIDRVSLSGISFDGANRKLPEPNAGLLELRRIGSVQIDNCTIQNTGGHALVLEACAGRVERCTIERATQAAIFAVDSTGLSITNNTVHACGNGGILVHRWEQGADGTIVANNRVTAIRADAGGTGQNGNGVNVFRAGNVIVSNNHVADCAFSAIRANSADNIQISNNLCLRSGETAIYSEFTFQGATITGNTVDGAAVGISVANFNEGGRLAICANNLVRNLSASGPYPADAAGFGLGISVEADTSVSGNIIEGAPATGIHLGWGPYLRDVSATGNIIRDCGWGIGVSVVDGAGAALIANNLISGAKQGGIVGHRWADHVTGDLVSGEGAPAHLTITGNRLS